MLKLLFRKQLFEMYKGYFYDQKTKTAKTKGRTVLSFVLFAVLMLVVLGSMFTGLSFFIGKPTVDAGIGWLFFSLMGSIAMLLGLFGSVFNTYASLYMSKDNELLLSLPIPVRDIILSRLLSVYALGFMYSGIVFIPAVIVYQILRRFSLKALIGSLLMFVFITLFVLVLSCLLGYVVARIAAKLKNKSLITVVISLAFIAAYYVFYAKAGTLVTDLVENTSLWGDRVIASAYPLYLFGRLGEGDWLGLLICLAATVILCVLVYMVISHSFIKTALSTGRSGRSVYKEKKAHVRTVGSALLAREGKRLTSSATYMLNCALGVLFIPLLTVFIAVKGTDILSVLDILMEEVSVSPVILLIGMVIMAGSMTMTAEPAVSMEGKSLWLVRSLPVTDKQILNAKIHLQLLLSCIPTLLYGIVCVIVMIPVLHPDIWTVLLFLILPQLANVLYAYVLMLLGIRYAVLDWSSETIAIKNNLGTLFSIFIEWGYGIAFVGLAFLLVPLIGTPLYLLAFSVLTAVLILLFSSRLYNVGIKKFKKL